MSKSKNNGVDPQQVIERYGADTARLFVMFAAPPEQTMEWNDAGVEGANRFLKRVWSFGARLAESPATAGDARALRFELHTLLRQVSYDYERMQYNTVVSGAMKMLNALEAAKGRRQRGAARRLRAAAARALPGLPAHRLGAVARAGLRGGARRSARRALASRWTRPRWCVTQIELVLQVNGKLRGALRVAADAGREAIEAAALASPDFAKFAEGRAPKKVVVVPGRLVNVVV